MAKRITPMSRKYMDATPTPEPGGIDLVDLLKKINEGFQYLQGTNQRAGRDVEALQAGVPKINLGKPTPTPTPAKKSVGRYNPFLAPPGSPEERWVKSRSKKKY